MNVVERLLENPYPLRYVLGKRVSRYRHSYSREHYYYCIRAAAETAAALGIPKISVLEFGVAGGNGLLDSKARVHQPMNSASLSTPLATAAAPTAMPGSWTPRPSSAKPSR